MTNDRETREPQAPGVTRRGFISGIGASAAGAVALPANGLAQEVHDSRGPRDFSRTRSDRFSRLFDRLTPFAEPTANVQRALRDLGAPGGLMDAKDPLSEGPIRLITNPELSPNNRDSAAHSAGVTFFGQFLDHDMTFDATSRLGVPTLPERSQNTRTPKFDLDSVYGGGPSVSPQLYDPADRATFKIGHGGLFEDLPRNPDGMATIADPRNDENLIIAGLQCAFLMFHNRVVEQLRHRRLDDSFLDGDRDDRHVFEQARRMVIRHYQWMIVHEFLPAIIGAPLVAEILSRGPHFYTSRLGDHESIPVEFQVAYRFGHSLIRPSYRANLAGDGGQPSSGSSSIPKVRLKSTR